MKSKKSTLICIMLTIFLFSISLGCTGDKTPQQNVTPASQQNVTPAPQPTATSTKISNSDLNVTISSPVYGSKVNVTEPVTGNSTGVYENRLNLYVLINPLETSDEWWVQPKATVSSDGTWVVSTNFGNPGDEDKGKQFWMVAIVTPNTLNTGKTNYPSGEFSTKNILLTRI